MATSDGKSRKKKKNVKLNHDVFIFMCGTECDEKTSLSKTPGMAPIETIISASKVYGDTLLA